MSRGFRMRSETAMTNTHDARQLNEVITPLSPRWILKPRGEGFRMIETREERQPRVQQENEVEMNRMCQENKRDSGRIRQDDQQRNRCDWRDESFQPKKAAPVHEPFRD